MASVLINENFKIMHYNVPQFIDIEDRIVGPLTGKQLLWMFAMGAVLLIMWMMIDNKVYFFMFGIPVALLFVALAFYRPYGQPLSKFIGSAFLFIIRPKVYLWKREAEIKKSSTPNKVDVLINDERKSSIIKNKVISKGELENLAKVLDSEKDILGNDNFFEK